MAYRRRRSFRRRPSRSMGYGRRRMRSRGSMRRSRRSRIRRVKRIGDRF